MRCEIIKTGKFTAIVCGSGKRRPRCRWCPAPATKLCDFPVRDFDQVYHSCDGPICDAHATVAGKNRHFCPMHGKQGKLAL